MTVDSRHVAAVGDGISAESGAWEFSGDVPQVFVDHVRHSVPSYDTGHEIACDLAACFMGGQAHRLGYELGSATGHLLRRLATFGPAGMNTRWIGVDREAGMITTAREHCRELSNVEVVLDDVATMAFEPCDFVVSYLTLHFLPIDQRIKTIHNIYRALRPGGGFFLFEKVRAPDAQLEDLITTMHYRWKRRAGLTPEEILNKKESLLGVLQPISTDSNAAILHDSGFRSIDSVFKHLCFEGFIAIK